MPVLSIVYIKFKNHDYVHSFPLCEIIDGTYVEDYLLSFNAPDGLGHDKKFTKEEFGELLESSLCYGTVDDFTVQLGGELSQPHITDFLAKYKKS